VPHKSVGPHQSVHRISFSRSIHISTVCVRERPCQCQDGAITGCPTPRSALAWTGAASAGVSGDCLSAHASALQRKLAGAAARGHRCGAPSRAGHLHPGARPPHARSTSTSATSGDRAWAQPRRATRCAPVQGAPSCDQRSPGAAARPPPRRRPGRRRACSRPGARRPQHLNQRGLGGPRRGRGRVAPHDERRRGDHYALHPAPVQPKAHAPAPTRAGVAEPAAQRRLPTWPSMPGRCFRMPLQMRPAHDCDRRAARQRRHSGAAAPPQLTACDATQTCRWRGRTCRRAC
jgi:hypothetical protein